MCTRKTQETVREQQLLLESRPGRAKEGKAGPFLLTAFSMVRICAYGFLFCFVLP